MVVVVVEGPRAAVAVEHADAPFPLVVGGRSPGGEAGFPAAEERVADQRAVHELLVAGRRHFLRAARRLELADVKAEQSLALREIDVERRVLEKRAGVGIDGVVADEIGPVQLCLVGEPRLDHPAFELGLDTANPERSAILAAQQCHGEREVVARRFFREPHLHAGGHFQIGAVGRDARLAVAPDHRLDGLDRVRHRLGDAVLEEVQLKGPLVVADDGLAVRAGAGLRDADAHLARLLEPLGIGRHVEDVDPAVFRDLLVIHPLRKRRRGAEHQPGCDAAGDSRPEQFADRIHS